VGKQLDILLVEDDSSIREIAAMALSLDGAMSVFSCDSGFRAMKTLIDPQRLFDVVLLDMTLQDSTGLEVIEAIRAAPLRAHVPVIFFTASAGTVAKSSYLDAGAIGMIAKPFDPMTLAAQVRTLLAEHAPA
jgi:DNA-binding response OmpR family regulator